MNSAVTTPETTTAIKKYIIIKPKFSNHYLLEVDSQVKGMRVVRNKRYTLRDDGKIKKNKHQHYSAYEEDLQP